MLSAVRLILRDGLFIRGAVHQNSTADGPSGSQPIDALSGSHRQCVLFFGRLVLLLLLPASFVVARLIIVSIVGMH